MEVLFWATPWSQPRFPPPTTMLMSPKEQETIRKLRLITVICSVTLDKEWASGRLMFQLCTEGGVDHVMDWVQSGQKFQTIITLGASTSNTLL
jgi:hypothetical protein